MVEIAAPRSRVVAPFDAPADLSGRQADRIGFEPISGTPGRPGAGSRLACRLGERTLTLKRVNALEAFAGSNAGG